MNSVFGIETSVSAHDKGQRMQTDDTSSATSASNGDVTPTPRWVLVLGIITVVAILLFVVTLLAGGDLGEHGPGRHLPPTSVPTHRLPAS